MEILRFEDVFLSFGQGHSKTDILKGVDFSLDEGEFVSLVGTSGSGKSSILMLATGLEGTTSGRVFLLGRDIGELSKNAQAEFRGKNVGILFQSFHLFPMMTVYENIAAPLEILFMDRIKERVMGMVEQVGLSHRIGHYPVQLSGGEQQRTALARSLISEPRVVFADEPTGNLDEEMADEMAGLIISTVKKNNATLLLVTHDTLLADRADKRLLVSNGKVTIV